MIWSVFAAFLLVPMALQWLILRVTQRRFRALRWALPALPAYLGYQGHWRIHAPFEEYPHPDGLAGTLLYIFAALALAGWGLGWLLYKIRSRRNGKCPGP